MKKIQKEETIICREEELQDDNNTIIGSIDTEIKGLFKHPILLIYDYDLQTKEITFEVIHRKEPFRTEHKCSHEDCAYGKIKTSFDLELELLICEDCHKIIDSSVNSK